MFVDFCSRLVAAFHWLPIGWAGKLFESRVINLNFQKGFGLTRMQDCASGTTWHLSSAEAHFLDMEGVRGSIPLPPTIQINVLAFVSSDRAHVSPMKCCCPLFAYLELIIIAKLPTRDHSILPEGHR